ncbi:MAG: hypothetical protein JWM33_895 [Caulobacteraceae bacterium]|nr:hypothetical protein [Caulobacteraceae bacterium]
MTLPDPGPVRKPPSRFWLYAPFVLLAVVAAAWGIGWTLIVRQGFSAMDLRLEGLRQAGWQVEWSKRAASGWPFRFEVDFHDLKLVGPLGRGVSSPLIRSEAYVYDPGKWIAFAPGAITLERPDGPVKVQGTVIRGSLTGLGKGPMDLTFEGRGLTFTPAPDAKSFPMTAADRLIFSLRQGPNDQGAVLIDSAGLKLTGDGLLADWAKGKDLALGLELVGSHRSMLNASDWVGAWRRWNAAGGQFEVQKVQLDGPEDHLKSAGGTLTVAQDGFLQGEVVLDGPACPGRPAEGGPPKYVFKNGAASVKACGVALPTGPAPHLF